uniref:Uncharacterized protein n=1 Tax=Salix viminalis TaxID=40686 RepID=A0A6N2NC22_SALVM
MPMTGSESGILLSFGQLTTRISCREPQITTPWKMLFSSGRLLNFKTLNFERLSSTSITSKFLRFGNKSRDNRFFMLGHPLIVKDLRWTKVEFDCSGGAADPSLETRAQKFFKVLRYRDSSLSNISGEDFDIETKHSILSHSHITKDFSEGACLNGETSHKLLASWHLPIDKAEISSGSSRNLPFSPILQRLPGFWRFEVLLEVRKITELVSQSFQPLQTGHFLDSFCLEKTHFPVNAEEFQTGEVRQYTSRQLLQTVSMKIKIPEMRRSNFLNSLSFANDGICLSFSHLLRYNAVRFTRSEKEPGNFWIAVHDRSRTLSPCKCLKKESAIISSSIFEFRNNVESLGHIGEQLEGISLRSSTPLMLPAIVIIPSGRQAHSAATSFAICSTSGESAASSPSFSLNKFQASSLVRSSTLILSWQPICLQTPNDRVVRTSLHMFTSTDVKSIDNHFKTPILAKKFTWPQEIFPNGPENHGTKGVPT